MWGIAETESQPLSALSANPASPATTQTNEARFNVTALGGPWIPVAYRPTSVTLPGARVLPGSLTVIRDGEINTTYTVRSADPAPTPFQMATARVVTGASAAADLNLPSNFPPRVRALAHSITDEFTTPYAKALALQNYLRHGYDYSLSVPKGHSDQALVDFLFTTKAGFCEQFSSAFAAMARAIGLPTRVAVGFTSGTQDPSGTYHVSSDNAHAWPEVDFDGIGWIRFEPTPGRFDPTTNDPTQTGNQEPEGHDPDDAAAVEHTGDDHAGRAITEEIEAATGREPRPVDGRQRHVGAPVDRIARAAVRARAARDDSRCLPRFRGHRRGAKALRRWRRRHAPTDRARRRRVGRGDRTARRSAHPSTPVFDAGRVRDA